MQDEPQIESLPNYPNPLVDSYTYHSKCPTTKGKYMMGVDEAGRGPVLGPMVYGIAFCPVDYKETLDQMGFNGECGVRDSKQLDAQKRSELLNTLSSDSENLGWAVQVISPQDLSRHMISRPPINLNVQSQNATIKLIKMVQEDLGIEISHLYVDALGNSGTYQKYLKECFPNIESIVVETKADAKYKIVGAASVAAKVTRDAWIEGWIFEESTKVKSPKKAEDEDAMPVDDQVPSERWDTALGSGYPSDPKTKAWIQATMEPTFGFPSIARFSWATIKTKLDESGHRVLWTDDGHTLAKAFVSATPRDKGRCVMTKELGIRSVGSL